MSRNTTNLIFITYAMHRREGSEFTDADFIQMLGAFGPNG